MDHLTTSDGSYPFQFGKKWCGAFDRWVCLCTGALRAASALLGAFDRKLQGLSPNPKSAILNPDV